MGAVEQILEGVEIDPRFSSSVAAAQFEPDLGFLHTPESIIPKQIGQTVLFGFGYSGWQQGSTKVAERFTGKTDISQIAPELCTLPRQGRGTGARLYNTIQATAGAQEIALAVGLYAYAVDLDNLADKRHGLIRQRANSLGLVLAAKLLGGELQAIETANGRTEGFDGILYNQTPDGLKQKKLKQAPPSLVPERLMVVRRPDTLFQKVGEYRR